MPLPDQVSQTVRDLNPHLFGPAAALAVLPTAALAKRAGRPPRDERELQAACENYLALRGYRRLTADEAERTGDMAGWFGHLAKPIGNPLMPDLWIFDTTGRRCLLVELKVRPVFQPGQRDMIRMAGWELCRTLEEFLAALAAWEANTPLC
jgi:hypothetical protein